MKHLEVSPFDLFAAGRNKDALAQLRRISSTRELDLTENVLHAELLCARGEHGPAMALAQRLLEQGTLSDAHLYKLRFVLGQCSFHQGQVAKGSEHFRVGAELAARTGRVDEECRLRIQLFRHEIRVLGAHRANAADLEALRRAVHRAGNPAIALIFQIALTELATQLALLTRARKHLETARSLASQVQNLELHGKFRHTEVVLTILEGHTAEALRLALNLVEDECFQSEPVNLLITIGHLFLMQGNFDESEAWLQRAMDCTPSGGGREVGVLDTMMYVKLYQGDKDGAKRLQESIGNAMARNHALHDSIYAFWHLPTRAQWLFSLGRFEEGLQVITTAMPRIAQVADLRLIARAKLLIAEGLGKLGRANDGAVQLGEAIGRLPQPPLEIIAEAARVTGSLLADSEPALSLAYYGRARQTLEMLGYRAPADAVLREQHQSLRTAQHCQLSASGSAALWCERFAALLSVGGYPLLLGAQVQALIEDSDAATDVRVAIANLRAPESDRTSRITLGDHRNVPYELRFTPNHTARDLTTIQALASIVQSSLDLAHSKASEREQTFWPARSSERPLGLICSSEVMLELVQAVRRVAASDASVLLTGETGVGKELFAKAIHQTSTRSGRTFLPFNCSTVPREMIDSQLFGHKRGSFTGAIGDSSGVIRAAAGGTLFLDEIGEMSLESQPKLLRFLESGEILPLGETKPQHVDVRVVAATNANLDQLVAEGLFREDLYYRLNVIRLEIPPLRERREEIPALVEHFLEKSGRELDKPLIRIADETLEYLVLYRWPGNVRQLSNEIRRLVTMAEPGGVIMPAHLSDDIAESRRTLPANRSPRLFDEVVTRIDQPLSAAVEHIERAAIQRALAITEGHLDEAARLLGLSRKGLYLKRQRLNLG